MGTLQTDVNGVSTTEVCSLMETSEVYTVKKQ